MKNEKGFTLIELLIVIAIVVILVAVISGAFINNRGATEGRAMEAAQKFVAENGITAKRLTCAGDSDGDGYGTCNLVTKEGEKIILQCPTNFGDTKFFGASQCKEVFQNLNFSVQ